jgi:pimeloyl-ACP methyl ester carboxylesterase
MRALAKMMVDRAKDGPIDYAAVVQPVLLLWSDSDRWAPVESGEHLRDLLANARLEVLSGAGHLLLEEKPEEANRAILDFVRESPAEPGRVEVHPEACSAGDA